MNYSSLLVSLLPEISLVISALLVLSMGLVSRKGSAPTYSAQTAVAMAGLVVAGMALFVPDPGSAFADGMIALEPLERLFKFFILGMGVLTLGLAPDNPRKEHNAEYLSLALFSITGMLLVVSSNDLLMVFLGLELVSLPLFILSAFDRSSKPAAEAGLKFFLFGAASSAFMLFGFSLIYGFTHTTQLDGIAGILARGTPEPVLSLGIVMALAGFGFKVAAVPFHLWAPDTYQVAPLPTAILIAAGSKVAGFFILAKFVLLGLPDAEATHNPVAWTPALLLLAVFSMLLGNLGALAQRSSVRRLLAYSAIAHGGYILLGLCGADHQAVGAVLFYLVIYGLTIIGSFAIVGFVESRKGGDQPANFSGLWHSSPPLALALVFFFVSLAGLPPLASFFGKFNLFLAAMNTGLSQEGHPGLPGAVALAVALNALSLYYYLQVLKFVFVADPTNSSPLKPMPLASLLTVAGALTGIVLAGLFPQHLLEIILQSIAR